MNDDDFKLLRGFEDGRTFVNVESFSRLKIPFVVELLAVQVW